MSRLWKFVSERYIELIEGFQARIAWGRVKEIYDEELEPDLLMIDNWPKAIAHIGARLVEPAERKWRRETIETWAYHRNRAVKARSPEERFYAGNIAAVFDAQFVERVGMTIQEYLDGGHHVDK
jgi:hypothetical protein